MRSILRSWQLACLFLASMLLMIALPLFGCAPERIDGAAESLRLVDYDIDTSSYEAMRATTPERVTETIGSSLKIDARVVLPAQPPETALNAELYGFAGCADAIAHVLMGESSAGYRTVMDDKDSVLHDGGPQEDVYYEMPDGAILRVGPYDMGFSDATFDDRYIGTGADAPQTDSLPPFAQEELTGFSSESAMNQVWELLEAMGFGEDDVASMVAYALPASKMQAAKDEYVLDGFSCYEGIEDDEEGLTAQLIAELKEFDAIEYGQEDEMYSVHVRFNVNGTPLSSVSYGSRYCNSADFDSVGGCYLRAYVGREGIRNVSADSIFKGGSAIDGDGTSLIALDEAVNALGKRYGSVASAKLAATDSIALEYCPIPVTKSETGVVLAPAWVFRSAEDPDYGIRINALTGEVI